MPNIPLLDLRAQYQTIKPEIDRAIQQVLDRGQFILGPEVEALEREIAAYCAVPYAVAVASGTDALELSLRACGIGPGDEVLTSAFSFFATAEAIVAVGATPVFADIELAAYNLDPAALEARLSPRTKAIIPVHLFGHPCAMDQIMAAAKAHRVRVIEDCAQAIGAKYHEQPVGSFGDAAALSFYPTKNLGGYGDGGMVLTKDAKVAEQIRLLRAHGSRGRYHHEVLGTNSRLDELQAAVLRVKLRHLDAWNEARRRHAQRYEGAVERHGARDVVLPQALPGCSHVYHLYTIRTPRRDRIREGLAAQGIANDVYYPTLMPSQAALSALKRPAARYPRAEEAAASVLSIPMYPELTPGQIDEIVQRVARASHVPS